MMPWWVGLIIGIVALLIGAVIGLLIMRKIFATQMEKNPPITESR